MRKLRYKRGYVLQGFVANGEDAAAFVTNCWYRATHASVSQQLWVSVHGPLCSWEWKWDTHTSGSVWSSQKWAAPGGPSLKWAPPLSDRSDAWLCQICMSTNDNDQIQIIIRFSSSNFKAWHPSPSLVLFWSSAGRKTICPKPNDTLGKQKTTLSQTLVILKKTPMVSLV